MRVLLSIPGHRLGAHPAAHENTDGTKPFGLFGRKELGKDFVECTTGAMTLCALALFVTLGQEERSDKRVVNQTLDYHAHKACLTHVIKASKADGSTRGKARILRDEPDIFR